MASVDTILHAAEQQCSANGVKLTSKRKHILSALLQSEKALSAYEITDFCQQHFGLSMPTMSVYRILDFLQQQHLVHALKIANKYVACSHISCEHDHQIPQFLICSACQRVKEVGISQSLMHSLSACVDQAGYQLQSPQLEMDCLCENCKPSPSAA